jgi:hypothetical protein
VLDVRWVELVGLGQDQDRPGQQLNARARGHASCEPICAASTLTRTAGQPAGPQPHARRSEVWPASREPTIRQAVGTTCRGPRVASPRHRRRSRQRAAIPLSTSSWVVMPTDRSPGAGRTHLRERRAHLEAARMLPTHASGILPYPSGGSRACPWNRVSGRACQYPPAAMSAPNGSSWSVLAPAFAVGRSRNHAQAMGGLW